MFKNPFSFNGRIRRKEYALSLLIYIICVVFIFSINSGGRGNNFLTIGLIPLFWFLIAQGAKRCHDCGNSGWFQFIPLYGLWLLFAEGNTGRNEYGENPKG